MPHGLDIFISYKSEQHSWAARLAGDLERHGFTVFVDHDTAGGLLAGQGWKTQLANKIQLAERFFVLWSAQIGVGSYVLEEIDVRRQWGRPVTIVRLDDSAVPPFLDPSVHQFREFVDFYVADAADVMFFDWNRAVRHLVEQELLNAEGPDAAVLEIPVVVVAMTRDQANEIKAGARVVGSVKDDAFERLMDLLQETAPFDPERYGERPEDWRPFEPEPANPTVEEVIYNFDRAQRDWHRDHVDDFAGLVTPYVFVPYGDALRSASTRQRARESLQDGPALVVFDPISLVHEDVHGEVIVNGLHTLKKAFVIGLGPRISSALPPVRTYFSEVERALFNGLYMTDPHDRSRALFRPTLSTCVLNVAHGFELSRWLQVASESIMAWAGWSRTRMEPVYAPLLRGGPANLPSMVRPR
jgi:hypothetical protein